MPGFPPSDDDLGEWPGCRFHPGRLFVALDTPTIEEAQYLAVLLRPTGCAFKIGWGLFPLGGFEFARDLAAEGARVFIDAKVLDIPNTVENGVRAIASLGAAYTNVHAEPQAMAAAVRGRADADTRLLGVTVLTSMDDAALRETGSAFAARDLVLRRCEQAIAAGMDGVVASPQELADITKEFGEALEVVTPGIRPAGAARGDQVRVMTPADAFAAGASAIVMGRPILEANDPAGAVRAALA